MQEQSLSQVRAAFAEVVRAVSERHERVHLTRHGQTVAVLISPQDLAALEAAAARGRSQEGDAGR